MNHRLSAVLLAATLAGCTTELVCNATEVACNGQCVSTASDAANCGACGRSCGAGQTCSAGLCCQGAECPPQAYAACFNGDVVQGVTPAVVPVGAPVRVESGPIALAWIGSSLWVANSRSNTLDRMDVSPAGLLAGGRFPTVSIPVSGDFSDLEFLAESGGRLYVSNAAVGSLVVVDPAAASPVVGEVQLDPGNAFSYPQGIAFSSDGRTAYVALNGSSAVAAVDLSTLAVAKTYLLGNMASPGHLAMPSRLLVSGSRIYVTLWNLDATYYNPGNGRLAVIDTGVSVPPPGGFPVIDLGSSCQNPSDLALSGNVLWVTCGFFPYTATSASDIVGAAFVPLDLSGPSPVMGTPVPALDLQATPEPFAPGALTFCNGTGYVGDRFSGNVFRFDPASRSVTAQGLTCSSSTGASFVADVTCGR